MARIPKATKPNPGPWSYLDIGIIEDEDRNCLAECVNGPNGELMAAAPDLLEALKNMVALARPFMTDTSQTLGMKIAARAIAQAEGDA